MKKPVSRISIVKKYTPPWTKSIAASPLWESIVTDALPLHHIRLHKLQKAGDQNHPQDYGHDALYLSQNDIPKKAHDFIPLFNTLSPGGIALLELGAQSWSRSDTKRIASSLGAELKFFGSLLLVEDKENKNTKNKKSIKAAVLEKENLPFGSKKASILISVFSAHQDNPRVLEWLRFLALSDLLPFIEIFLVFDGIQDALPAWQECEGLEKEHGFQMLRHYQTFGKKECMRSALHFARGKYLLWDDSSVPCDELFWLIDQLPLKKEQGPLGIFSKSILSYRDGKQNGLPVSSYFFLLNQSAAKLIRQEKWKKKQNLLEEIQGVLKKHKTNIKHTLVRRKNEKNHDRIQFKS